MIKTLNHYTSCIFNANGFEWVKDLPQFKGDFIKHYNENSEKGYFLEVHVEYPKKLFNPHKDYHFYQKKRKLKNARSLFVSYKTKNTMLLRKMHSVIQFNQEAWLKLYINMNTKLRKEAKNDFEKDFFKLMNNPVSGKTMVNVRKHRDFNLVTTDKRRNQLVSESNYHTAKYFPENLTAIEMKKTKAKINKPIYLGMSILDISKTLMYEFW